MFQNSIRHIAGTENLCGDLFLRWISATVSTRLLTKQTLLHQIPNIDGEIGRDANSLLSVDVMLGVQLQYATLQKGGGSGFPTSFSSWMTET